MEDKKRKKSIRVPTLQGTEYQQYWIDMDADNGKDESTDDTDSRGKSDEPKKSRKDPVDSGFTIDDPLARHVYISSANGDNTALGKMHSFQISDALEELIGEFESCKKLNSGKILVQCTEYAQVRKLLQELSVFNDVYVKVEIAYNINTV